MFANARVGLVALLGGQELGVLDAVGVEPAGQDDGSGDERSGERAPPRFIGACYGVDPTVTKLSL